MYAKRLQTGDANVIETNKINLELLNVKTEASLNETALRNKIQELTALNGNIPVVFEDADYPAVIFPSNYEELKTEVMASDYTLRHSTVKVPLPANRLRSTSRNGYPSWNWVTVVTLNRASRSTEL